MKINIFICFLAFPILTFGALKISTPVRPVKVICLYRMTSRIDSSSATAHEEITQLAISDSLSEFRSSIRYKPDSLFDKYQNVSVNSPAFQEGLTQLTNMSKYKFDGIVIKNLKTNSCFYYGLINHILYGYEDDKSLNWKILADTASISGYKCQKAFIRFGGRDYSAWFTRQIPISNGPYKFGGLPGLIVLISDATNSYKFELMSIRQTFKSYSLLLPNEIIIPRKSAIIVSRRRYYESYFNAKKNFLENSLASGMVKFDDEEHVRKVYQEKIKHRNNPIEIDYSK